MMPPLQRRRLRVSSGELAFADLGDGPPVVLLHGFPTSSHLWRREAWLLAQRMRVIVPDLLGYGDSDHPADADLSEPAQAHHVGELLERLEIGRAAVVGHDIGGAVAQLLALDGPVEVPAMVLLDTACFEAWPIEGIRMIQGTAPDDETEGFVQDLVRVAFELGMAHPDRLEPDAFEEFLRPWTSDPKDFFRAVRGITGKGLSGRYGELAAKDIPTLVLWGEDDPFLPSDLAEQLGDTLPFSTVGLLPGCSHLIMEDAPETVGPLISEFLRVRYLGQPHSHATDREPVMVYLERPKDPFFDRGPGWGSGSAEDEED
jgi:2-hydroxymuconate-semialdehyde hydrolase